MSLEDLLDGFPVVVTVNVAWGDMDAYQHVNNTRLFRYMEDARMTYFERTGVADLSGLPQGIGPILAQTACRFRAPLKYPDEVQVGARVVGVGQHSFKMEYRVVSVAMHKIVATGSAVVVAFDYVEEKKALLPDTWRRALSSVEGCDLSVVRASDDDE